MARTPTFRWYAITEILGSIIGLGTNGKVTTDFGGNNDEATAVAVLPDYRIVVVGHTIINGSSALLSPATTTTVRLTLRLAQAAK